MGRVGEVVEVEPSGDVRVDLGGEDIATADGFAGAGSDCPPLPGDSVALADGVGAGAYQVAGYDDKTTKKAAGGEKRVYARDQAGKLTAEVHLKGDGSVEVTSLEAGGAKLTVRPDGTVRIDGDLEVSGEVTAMADTAPVGLSTHKHVAPTGITSPPQPGT